MNGGIWNIGILMGVGALYSDLLWKNPSDEREV